MESDQERLAGLTRRASEFARNQAAELEKKVGILKKRIEDLVDLRSEAERSPLCKEELLAATKETLAKGRAEVFMKDLLMPHLRDCQLQRMTFLNPATLRVHYLEAQLWKFVFAWISPEDIEEAIRLLPEDGIPEKTRRAKVEMINKQIKDLEREIEKLLA